jgi:hypothetical protein
MSSARRGRAPLDALDAFVIRGFVRGFVRGLVGGFVRGFGARRS